jgi:hypothetical protein
MVLEVIASQVSPFRRFVDLIYRKLRKPEGKRPLGRPRRRREDNIKMDLQKWEGVVGTGWSWLRIGTGGGRL